MERIIRTAVLAVLVCGFSLWSLWDGYVAYPRTNVESAIQTKIGVEPPGTLPVADPKLTTDISNMISRVDSLDAVTSRLGEPHFRNDEHIYYFGYGGFLKLELAGQRVVASVWSDGPKHGPTTIAWQKLMGFGLVPFGLVVLVQLARVLTTRVTLTEAGLKVRGKPPIPFDTMTALRATPGRKSGCFDLCYSRGGCQQVLRLDDYVVRETRAIVSAIRERKGFDDPLEPDQPQAE